MWKIELGVGYLGFPSDPCGTLPWNEKWCQIRRFPIIFKHLTYRHRLHSNAGGGLKGAHRGLEQRSQEAGMWYEIATNSCPFKSSIPEKQSKIKDLKLGKVDFWSYPNRWPTCSSRRCRRRRRRRRCCRPRCCLRVYETLLHQRTKSKKQNQCKQIRKKYAETNLFTWNILGISLASARMTSPWVTDRTWNTLL